MRFESQNFLKMISKLSSNHLETGILKLEENGNSRKARENKLKMAGLKTVSHSNFAPIKRKI